MNDVNLAGVVDDKLLGKKFSVRRSQILKADLIHNFQVSVASRLQNTIFFDSLSFLLSFGVRRKLFRNSMNPLVVLESCNAIQTYT